MPHTRRFPAGLATLLLASLVIAASAAASEQSPASHEAVEFFESRIRPVLVEHCYECHSAKSQPPQADLRLDDAAAFRQGGASGPPFVAGQTADSLLMAALRWQSLEMPPKGKLPDTVIADFERWIAMGAPDPRLEDELPDDDSPKDPSTLEHWSLQRPIKAPAPATADRVWPRSVIDAFVLARLEAAGLTPSPQADARTLLRRLSYDLTGLPPGANDLQNFADRFSDAEYEQQVDRLLASPQFGERWGRYWLDIARYADTKGYVFQEDRNYATAYKYRDWVIGALNGDMAFDRFVINQLAADQTGDPSAAAAMGFLTLGRRFLNSAQEINDDRIDLITRGLMGLTVACARCHDHKYDPIPTADYYALYGVLASCNEQSRDDGPPMLVDSEKPVEQHVLVRGNAGAPGDVVSRHFLTCLGGDDGRPFQQGSGRLELAQAIASRENPLTARVWVNRVWGKLLGRPLTSTPSDFGVRGDPPSHPELLDWLACTFMDEGWSTKRLIRRIVLTSAYRQASAPRDDCRSADPENALLARMNRRRLDLEAMRDSLLVAAGCLDSAMGGPSVALTEPPFATRRAVYGFIERQNLPAFFRTFDFANPNTPSASRPQTASPHQALFMLNSPFAIEQSRRLAARTSPSGSGGAQPSDRERISQLYLDSLGRQPSAEEIAEAAAYIATGEATDEAARFAALPRWQYGWGVYDGLSDRVEFHTLPHLAGASWQGSEALPDAQLGWAMLSAEGGHPGDAEHQVIRRWTAPAAGLLSIEGRLEHPAAQGDGVRGRIVSSTHGRIGEWTAAHGACDTPIAAVEVAPGDTVDFVVDGCENNGYDTFSWRATLRLARSDGPAETWHTYDKVDDPAKPRPVPLDRWGQLAQVLLMCNEFMFVD
jgi:hypothetical protein